MPTVRKGVAKAALAIAACLGMTVSAIPATALATPASEVEEARETCAELYAEAEKVNEELNGTKVKIDDLTERIDDIEASIQDDRASLKAQMRGEYKNSDPLGVIGDIVRSDSLSDMIDVIEYSSRIKSENESNIKSVTDATRELRAARDELSSLYGAKESSKRDLDARIAEADAYVESLGDDLRTELGLDGQDPSWEIPAEISSGTSEAWRDIVLTAAYANLGGEYVWGGESFKAADCSGLSKWCYEQAGIDIPHYSEDQAAFCNKSMSEALPGDIAWRPGHIGICIGGGRTIEAMSPGIGITYGSADGFYACGSPV